MEPITYVSITQNRVENLKRNLPVVLPYVDRAVIIDGGSVDQTAEYLESLSPKVVRIFRKWDDSFANQYNAFLSHINDGWVLICDDDELPSIELLGSLRDLMRQSNQGNNYCCVEFQCNNLDPEAHWDSGPTNYYRQIFFRWNPRMKYMVDLHQSLQGYQNNKVLRSSNLYYHIKTRKQEFQNACRNYFIGGYWPEGANHPVKDPIWYELKNILNKVYPNIQIFSDLNSLLIQGNIDSQIKEWIKKYKDISGQGYGELRAFYIYYFEILHPNE